jgi:hypothetical protein
LKAASAQQQGGEVTLELVRIYDELGEASRQRLLDLSKSLLNNSQSA